MSELEETMAGLIRMGRLPAPEREHRFARGLTPARQWRFDFAWPGYKVALEVEGGTFMGKGHTGGRHFESDCEKYNVAQIAGWVVIRATKAMVEDHRALDTITTALMMRGAI